MPKNIPVRLKAAMLFAPRHGRAIGNVELAEHLGITPSRLSQIRSGAPLSVAQLVKVCDYLGVNYEWLLVGAGRMARGGPDERGAPSSGQHQGRWEKTSGIVSLGFVETAIEQINDKALSR